jgi:hypothetical protein
MRLAPGTLVVLDTYALVERIARSDLVRRLLNEGLAARARKPPSPPSARIESQATGQRHMVTIELDVPADRDPDGTKNRIAARNAAALNATCPECGATLQELDSQPLARSRVSASVSAAQPVPASEQRFGKLIPSVSPGRRPAGRGRATVHLEMIHAANCRGAV